MVPDPIVILCPCEYNMVKKTSIDQHRKERLCK